MSAWCATYLSSPWPSWAHCCRSPSPRVRSAHWRQRRSCGQASDASVTPPCPAPPRQKQTLTASRQQGKRISSTRLWHHSVLLHLQNMWWYKVLRRAASVPHLGHTSPGWWCPGAWRRPPVWAWTLSPPAESWPKLININFDINTVVNTHANKKVPIDASSIKLRAARVK